MLATILKDLPALISLLFKHRLQDFGIDEAIVWMKYPFLQRLKHAADQAGIPDPSSTLLQWSETIHKDWPPGLSSLSQLTSLWYTLKGRTRV
jgi:hypothetical protein